MRENTLKAGLLLGTIMAMLLWTPLGGAQKPSAPPASATSPKPSPFAANPAAKAQTGAAQPAAGADKRTPAAAKQAPKPSASGPAAQQSGKSAAAPSASPKPAAASGAKSRDPFHTLIVEKKPPVAGGGGPPPRLPPGKRGLVIQQLDLQGIARAVDGSWIAVVDNKTKRAYFLREKDQLYNGTVTKITSDQVVFLETLNDGTGKMSTREVIKKVQAE